MECNWCGNRISDKDVPFYEGIGVYCSEYCAARSLHVQTETVDGDEEGTLMHGSAERYWRLLR